MKLKTYSVKLRAVLVKIITIKAFNEYDAIQNAIEEQWNQSPFKDIDYDQVRHKDPKDCWSVEAEEVLGD